MTEMGGAMETVRDREMGGATMAAWAQEGLEELFHVQGQKGWW